MALFSEARLRAQRSEFRKSLDETRLDDSLRKVAASGDSFDVFLSHSSLDQDVVRGLWGLLESQFGLRVYVDWIVDRDLDRTRVTASTVERLRRRMRKSKVLLFAASTNSPVSKWMPWELGYFDGLRGRAAVVPISKTEQRGDAFEGQEYLGVYPYAVTSISNPEWVWIHTGPKTYVSLPDWIAGKDPKPHP